MAATMAEVLQALSFPLRGSQLIEASAGTGKTWTIAALYLRLVLGHGGAQGFGRPLLPSEILVMTFTRAATRELSDRIRARLLQAAACLRGETAPDDVLLAGLMADYPDGESRSAAAWRLAMAAESMDDAAVHTIDAWCQRMLREHAFDSGCLFDEVLSANEDAMLADAARDYWRQQLYPLAGTALDSALRVWRDVAALTLDARELLTQSLPNDAGQGPLASLIAVASAERDQALAGLKQGWVGRASAMQAWVAGQLADKQCPFDKRKLPARHCAAWLDELAAWAGDPLAQTPDLKTGAIRLTPTGMNEVLKPDAWVELPAEFEAFAQLLKALAELQPLGPQLRLHAAARIGQRLAELKRQQGSFGFADLLQRLDQALSVEVNGANAERLRQRILAQYPVALVDEFQDTSPQQSRIFDRLYRIADNDPASALLLIGDPKQSIYGFRGADIHSYLGARRATEGRHHVLGTNHRSTQALVAAVNHLFEQAEARDGTGAFMFRTLSEAGDAWSNPLPFEPVQARGRAEVFVCADAVVPALTLSLDPRLLDVATSVREFAARCAEQIVGLLNDERAGFEHPQTGFRRLAPADIAVLVRTGQEAAAVRHELRRRQVASVYLSDKDSVFDSDEAGDLLRWLQAVASPLDLRLARAALATRTLGLSIAELANLADDDEAFDAQSEQLKLLNSVWRSQGVLTMLRQTLHRFDLPARWLGQAPSDPAERALDGERRLTNFLHLAELLQAASAQLDGEQALIRWLTQQIAGAAASGDEQIVRLESDADLVKLVTVHKSKGLEYPLVFLPFAAGFRPVAKARTRFVSLADGAGQRSLHLQPTAEQIAVADQDRLREDLRLLYVALTRARHALWVGVAALKRGQRADCLLHRSAIGYLLCGPDSQPVEAISGAIATAVRPCAGIALQRAESPSLTRRTLLLPRGLPKALREIVPYSASFERRWTLGSFSLLVRSLPAPAFAATLRDDERFDPADLADGHGLAGAADRAALPEPAADSSAASPAWHRFPRGALPGNFLHDQLEWLAGEGFDQVASPALQQKLLRRCERLGWGHRGPAVVDWLVQVIQTPLPAVGAALAEIADPLPEMEFWLPSQALDCGALDRLCRAHLLAGLDRPALPERELQGMLMGFADLVFEHGGRYWVLDYKSNHLGDHDAEYSKPALEAAMAEHRYDLQAALYLLALHRLLRSRLGASYDPARQLGGAVYLFLRGIRGPTRGCYLVEPSPALLDALDAMLGGTSRCEA